MRIVITTVGTRGDIQPMLAVARGLAAAGHDVTLATHRDFADDARAHGIGFRPMAGSFREICESDAGREWLESGDSLFRYRATVRRTFAELQRQWLDEADAAVEGADAVLSHPLCWGGLAGAERRGLPLAVLSLVPWVPTGAFRVVTIPLPEARWLNRRLNDWVHGMFGGIFIDTLRAHRAKVGLTPLPDTNVAAHYFRRETPHLHLYSEAVVPRPADWPAWAEVTGFCRLPDDGWSAPEDLARFLAAGPPPVYVGFGSMTGKDPAVLTRLALDAVRRAKRRAVVVTGWGGLAASEARDDVFVARDVPHAWLFPRCSVLVHHGGVGTFGAGLAAGRPTVVTPFFGDQPYWGRRAEALGVGPRAVQKKALTADRLARAIVEADETPAFRESAERIAGELAREDGVARAVARLEKVWGRC